MAVTKIFLDMDDVLCDFVLAIQEALGKPITDWPPEHWDMTVLMDVTEDEFRKPFKDPEFWANFEWTTFGQELLSALEDRFGTENICLCTDPSELSQAVDGKMQWVRKHIPRYLPRMMLVSAKHFAASEHGLLIDDKVANYDKFLEHKGNAILVPQVWNRRHAERHDQLGAVLRDLDNFF